MNSHFSLSSLLKTVTTAGAIALAVWLSGVSGAVRAAPPAGSFINNQISVTYVETGSGLAGVNTSNTVQAQVQQVAAFTLSAAQSKSAAAGNTVYFSHALTNQGNGNDTFALTIGDTFAGGFNLAGLALYVDANGDGVPDNLTPIASSGLVVPGAAFRFVAAAQVPAGATALAEDRLTVTAAGTATATPASAQSNVDKVLVSQPGPDLILQKTHAGSFATGANGVYTLMVRNIGAQATNNVVTVSDTLPPGLTFVSALSGGTSWTCAAAGQVISCNSPTIVPAQVAATPGEHPNPLSIVVKPDAAVLTVLPVTLTNNAVVSGGGEPLANNGNNAAADATVINRPANLSGRAWRDVNHDRIFNPGEAQYALAGWRVEVCTTGVTVCDASTRVGYTTTAADGTYSILGLPPGNYKAQFRDPNNNVVSAKPVNGDSGVAQAGSSVDANRRYLMLTLNPGDNLLGQSLPLDPNGVVFDSATRQPVAGARVVLGGPPGYDPAVHLVGGAANNTQITGANGFYQYILNVGFPNGTYTLTVTSPAGYQAAPSALFPPVAGPLDPPLGCTFPVAGICSVAPTNSPAPPVSPVAPLYHMSFVLNAGDPDVVNNHIPLDPLAGGGAGSGLLVSKTTAKQVAEIGDFVDYAVKVQNASAAAFTAVSLRDTLPAGFAYVANSGRLGGVAINPAGSGAPVFTIGTLAATTTVTLTYRAQLLPGAQLGDGINRAQASSGAVRSNIASVRVRVQGGVFSDKAYAVGKVFLDCNLNGVQDAGEAGIPGVRLYLQDGTNITTDREGRYSLYGLTPRTHVLKVDSITLPPGAQMVVISNRQAGGAASRFLDLRNGEMHKADFAVACTPELQGAVALRRAAAEKNANETERVLKQPLRPGATPVIAGDTRGAPAAGMVGGAPAAPGGATAAPGGATASATPAAAPVAPAVPAVLAASGAPAAHFEPVTPGPLNHTNSNLPAAPAPAAAALPLDKMIGTLDNTLGFVGLKDGDTLPYTQIAVRVKGPLGAPFQLTVNGAPVGAERVGNKLTLDDKKIQIWEYIGVTLKPGDNTVTVAVTDGFGNQRGSQSVKLIAPADLGKIVIDAPRDAPADGRSLVKIKVRLTDDRGVPVTVRTALTLESSRARWQADDVNPAEPGVQVFIEGGTAELSLQAPHDAGDDSLRISSGILNTEHKISFLPDLRPMIAAGVIEGAINFRSLNLRNLVSPRQRDSFEQEIERFSYTSSDGKTTSAGRAALFLKGKVKGDYLLTLAYDSDKNLKDRLFRDIQPDEFYPVYGDSSVRGFDAQSTQRLYLRVDQGKSFVLYGDYLTSRPGEARKLSDYSRTLTGLQSQYESGAMTVNAFASQDTFRQLTEEIAANGTSGPYQLNNRNAVINSEKIELLTRDRHQPAVILKTEPQARFADYEIELFTGRILFKGPLASLDQNLNPKSIRVIYEIDQGGENFWIGGAGAQVKLTGNIEAGASYVEDRNPQAPFRLGGLNSTLKLAEKTFLIGELARSETLAAAGAARRVELRHDGADFTLRLAAGRADAGFENPASQLTKGRTEATARATYKLTARTTLAAEAIHTADGVTQGRRQGVLLTAQHALEGGVKIEAGLRHSTETAAPAQAASAVAGATPNESTNARLRVTAPVPNVPQATVFGEVEHSLSGAERKVAALGGEYQFAGRGKLYGRHEFISSLSSPFALNPVQRNNTTVIGLDTDVAKDKQVFSEYRARDTIDGRAAEAALGLRSGWQLTEGLRLNTSSERIHTLSGPAANESVAYTGALEYTASPNLKANTRLEFRNSTQTDSVLGSLGFAYQLGPDWTTLVRGIHSVTENKGTTPGTRSQSRLQGGLAYRDNASDVWNGLGRLEYRNDEDTTLPGAPSKRVLGVGSLHVNYQPERATLINARMATKLVTEDSLGIMSKSSTHLFSGRVTIDLARDWDIGFQASLLASRGLQDRQFGLGAEIGYQVASNAWVSVGYNLFGFKEKDLTTDPVERGFFVRLRYKFDENVFTPAKDRPQPIFAAAGGRGKSLDGVPGAPGMAGMLPGSGVTGGAASANAGAGSAAVGRAGAGGVGGADTAALSGASAVLMAQAGTSAAGTAPAAVSADALLDTAERLVQAGRSAEAYDLLLSAERELIGELRFDYLIGVAALDAGKPDMALLAFSRVIAAHPAHAGARIDLARTYMALGQKDMAKGELEGVLLLEPPLATRRRIDDFLKDVRPSGRLTGYVAATAGYDSNLNHSPSKSEIHVPLFGSNLTLSKDNVQRAAAFGSAAAGLRYAYDIDSRAQVFAGADASHRGVISASPFNTGSAGAYAGGVLKRGQHQFNFTGNITQTELAGNADRSITSVTGGWNYNLAAGRQLGLALTQSQVRQAVSALRVFDTSITTLNLSLAGAVGPRTNFMTGLVGGVERNLNGNPLGAKMFYGARVMGEYKLRHDLTASAGVTAMGAAWDRFDVAFQTERADLRVDLTAGLNWAFADGWSLQPRWSFNDNRSSIPIYTYRRHEWSVTLRREW